MQEIKLTAGNVKGGGCLANIQKGLGGISGIETVNVDIPMGDVSIQFETPDLAATRISCANWDISRLNKSRLHG